MFFFALPHSDMYLAAGEFMKAIEIMGQNGWVERYKNVHVNYHTTSKPRHL